MAFSYLLQNFLKIKDIIKCPKIKKEKMLVMASCILIITLSTGKHMQTTKGKSSRSKAFWYFKLYKATAGIPTL